VAALFFWNLFSFFDFFPSFSFFHFSLFLPSAPGNRDGGDREAAAQRVSARGGGWMSSGNETKVTRKDGAKGRKHK
jgi:hypothetical protein